jgi:hypothetical protein
MCPGTTTAGRKNGSCSPVRAHPYGVRDINRWVQQRFRATELRFARQPWGLSLGDEEIVASDKVILTRNGKTKGWAKGPVEEYLANGEVGVMAFKKSERFLNACFTGRDGLRLRRPPGTLSLGRLDQHSDIPPHQVITLGLPDRPDQHVVRDLHRPHRRPGRHRWLVSERARQDSNPRRAA